MENISAKDLGEHRRVTIRALEAGSTMLNLGTGFEDEFGVSIPRLAANSKQKFEMIVKIVSNAIPYEVTKLDVYLNLSPPNESQPVPIQRFRLPIQISNHYRYNTKASVLLVTNSSTSRRQVEEWLNLTSSKEMIMDIYNVSLYGHMGLNDSILNKYLGKTVVLLGNAFDYFERGQRTVMDFIDKRDLAAAVFGGTSFIVSNMELNQTIVSRAPRFLRSGSYPHCRHFTTVKTLVRAVAGATRDSGFEDTKFVISVRRGRDCLAKAQRCATELRKYVPGFRFAIMPSVGDLSGQRAGEIEVLPCVPYDYGRFTFATDSTLRFSDLNGFLLQYSLPFQTRLSMLWDMWADGPSGLATFRGLPEIMEFDLVVEMARFIASDLPWPDCIEKDDILSHLKRVAMFLGQNTALPFSHSSIGRVVTILGNLVLLTKACLGSMPLALTFKTRRKNLKAVMAHSIDVFLAGHYGHLQADPARLAFQQYLREQSQQLSKEKQSKRKERLVHRVRAQLPVGVAMCLGESIDLVDLELMGNIVGQDGEGKLWQRVDTSQAAQMELDLEHSKGELGLMSCVGEGGPLELPTYSKKF
jgi:hypothetical protein